MTFFGKFIELFSPFECFFWSLSHKISSSNEFDRFARSIHRSFTVGCSGIRPYGMYLGMTQTQTVWVWSVWIWVMSLGLGLGLGLGIEFGFVFVFGY